MFQSFYCSWHLNDVPGIAAAMLDYLVCGSHLGLKHSQTAFACWGNTSHRLQSGVKARVLNADCIQLMAVLLYKRLPVEGMSTLPG